MPIIITIGASKGLAAADWALRVAPQPGPGVVIRAAVKRKALS
jgi:hypothetical protein